MADSCSNWWHCPFYFSMSLTLVLIAISTSKHSPPKPDHQIPPPRKTPLPDKLSSAASLALRNHGFAATATLLQISPELLHSSPETTLFAIDDSAFSTISALPDSWKQLLEYHTCPSKLPIKALSKYPNGTCFSTLVPHKNIAITKTEQKQGRFGSIEINNVLVSHPDLFLGGPITIHGVIGPFSSLPANGTDREWEINQPSVCNSSNVKISSTGEFKNTVEWNRVVGFMSSNGFVSFAVRLRSVLDGILVDYPELSTVTIFAPLDFLFVTPSWPLLDRMVRFHMVPRRLSFVELGSLLEKSILSTLVPGRNLVITRNAYSERMRVVAVNGVEVVAPDSFSSAYFVVHGISGAFSMGALPSL